MSSKFSLLTDESANVKLSKSEKTDYLSVGLSLAPHNASGRNVCPHATAACRASCVAYAGNGNIPNVAQARIRKTKLFFDDRASFFSRLREDLSRADELASTTGKKLSCRLNMFSDIAWEQIAPDLFTDFAHVQFYDYTKSATRAGRFGAGDFPENYHLTFSRSETNDRKCVELLFRDTVSVSVLLPQFRGTTLPTDWHGIRIVDGDESDLRFQDPRGVIVGLRAKGTARSDFSGFVDRSNLRSPLLDLVS